MNAEDKLAAALWEADRHLQTLQEALKEWEADPAVGWEALDADRLKVRLVDQLLFRFTKLQDALGERLIPDTRFHGYDDTRFISEGSDNNTHTAPAKA
jgi:hypothetical protein